MCGLCSYSVSRLLIVEGAQIEAVDQSTPRQVDDWAQHGEAGGLRLGVNKKKNPSILQPLEGEGLLAPLGVAGEGAIGKAAAASKSALMTRDMCSSGKPSVEV